MTVKIVVNPNQSVEDAPKHYFGKSGDAKPTIASPIGLPPPTIGSDFVETDTQAKYVTGDGANWILEPQIKAMNDLKAAIEKLEETLSQMVLDTARIRTGHEKHTWGQPVEEIT